MESCLRYRCAALFPTLLLLLCPVVGSEDPCLEKCSCFDTFVSCYQFTEDMIPSLPNNLQTLILKDGKIHSFPHPFVELFPKLSFLEIQSTEVETIVDGTFSGMEGIDHLAIVDSQVGSIESGAFRDTEGVSKILISNSSIRTVQSGAFSALSNVQEFSVWSSSIEEVKQGAFQGLSDVASFSFYLNNVTAVSPKAFQNVRNFGKVNIYKNQFTGSQGSAVVPLTQASNETKVFSNTLVCQCDNVQAFHRPEMLPFLKSQNCTMPETGELFALSEVNVTELCINQPTTPPTLLPETSQTTPYHDTREPNPKAHSSTKSSMTHTQTPKYPTSDTSTVSSANTQYPTKQHTSSPSGQKSGKGSTTGIYPGKRSTAGTQSPTFSHGTGPKTTPATVSNVPDISSQSSTYGVTSSAVPRPDEKDGNGKLTKESSKAQNMAVSLRQTSVVFVLVAFAGAWLVSIN